MAMLEIGVPALRIGSEDIAELAGHFLRRFAARLGGRRAAGEDALERLRGHRWPGNLREFENAIRGAVVQCDSAVIEARDLAALGETWDAPVRRCPRGG